MRFDLVTIFPEFFGGPLDHGIVRRARETGLIDVHVEDLRIFTKDRHRTVDDRPFGGGEGMVLKPEPLFEAVESLLGDDVRREEPNDPTGVRDGEIVGARHAVPLQNATVPDNVRRFDADPARIAVAATAVVLLSASGKLFRQET